LHLKKQGNDHPVDAKIDILHVWRVSIQKSPLNGDFNNIFEKMLSTSAFYLQEINLHVEYTCTKHNIT
jgi:hypothetical protein